MSDDDLRQRVRAGADMRTLAEVAGLFDLLAKVRVAYLETIADSKPTDTAGREAIYHRIKAHDDIVKAMSDVIREGANSRAMIEALTKKQEKKAPNVA